MPNVVLRSCEGHIASWATRDPQADDRDGRPRGCPAEIGFTGGRLHVRVEFGVVDGLAAMTVFAAPVDEDAVPGMGVLHVAPPPEHARAIGRALLALADAAERGGDAL